MAEKLKRTAAPTEPGWYWGRLHGDTYPAPYAVTLWRDALVVDYDGEYWPLRALDWFGPIERPEVEP